jgi:hypothetical protein
VTVGAVPWLSLHWDDEATRKSLLEEYAADGIPSLRLFDDAFNLISSTGVPYVMSSPPAEAIKAFPWVVADLNKMPDGINASQSIIALLEGCPPEEQEKAISALSTAALHIKRSASEAPLFFYSTVADGPVSTQIRGLVRKKAVDSSAHLLLLDIQKGGAYYEMPSDEDVTEDSIKSFVDRVAAGSLVQKHLRKPHA